jgi:6-phospho-3-hexuloisomerase
MAVGQEIADLLERLDANSFVRFVEAFRDGARRWFFSGQGRSGLSARMAAMRFMHLGRDAHVVGESTAPAIREGDGLVIVSGSGETAVSVHFARVAKGQGAEVILLTHRSKSTLADIADTVLVVPVEKTEQFGGSLFEQCSLIVLDAVVLELGLAVPDAHRRMHDRHANLQ